MSTPGAGPDSLLPVPVRDAIAELTGEVVRVAAANAGFTPGVKYLAETSNGGFFFNHSASCG